MKNISVSDEYISQLFGKAAVNESKKENTKVETKVNESEETATHTCPLCESTLTKEISVEKIEEMVNYFIEVINESYEDEDSDSLDEDLETEEESEEEEDDSDTK